jgi:glycosyltransferase involved in cell wall biosynthesis
LILPYQSKDIFFDFLSSAHIGVVSIAKGAEKVCIPSKTYNLLSFGIPILGIAEDFSDLSHLINENQVGKCFRSEDVKGMADYVKELKENKESRYAENALQTSQKFTDQNALKFLEYQYEN